MRGCRERNSEAFKDNSHVSTRVQQAHHLLRSFVFVLHLVEVALSASALTF